METKINLSSLDQLMEKQIAKFGIPGLGLAVVVGDEVVYEKGFGVKDIETKAPVNPKSMFAIGSASKAFTTMGLALLVDRGLLDWDKPVRDYIPEFALYDKFATERMSARDLVCHRSGLPRHDLLWYGSTATRKDMFDRLRYLVPNKDFRTYMQYQNLMFLAAGVLIEHLSGKTWEKFTEEEIFAPLGMKRSNVSVTAMAKDKNAAKPYEALLTPLKEVPYRNIDAIGPAGSINSTIEDMTKWLRLHLNDGMFEGKQIVSKANLAEMHNPNMVITGDFFSALAGSEEVFNSSYGLGWFIETYRGYKSVHHGGHIDGFTAHVAFLPQKKIGVVALMNLGGSGFGFVPAYHVYDVLTGQKPVNWAGRIHTEFKKSLATLKASRKTSADQRQKGTRPSHKLDAYVGKFNHPGYGDLTITLKDGKLSMRYNTLDFALKHYHYDIFEGSSPEMEEATLKPSFISDLQGMISEIRLALEPNVEAATFKRVASDELKKPAYLKQFVGKYLLQEQEIEVSLNSAGKLVAALPGEPPLELEPFAEMVFKAKEMPGGSLEFVKNTKGKVDKLKVIQPMMTLEAKKK